MDEWIRWAVGIIAALVAALYFRQEYELRRLAKNIHSLRTMVQTVVIVLAAHGITVRRDDDERG